MLGSWASHARVFKIAVRVLLAHPNFPSQLRAAAQILSDLLLSRDPEAQFHQAHEMAEFNCDPRFMDEHTFLLHFMNYPQGYKIPWMSYCNATSLKFEESHFARRIRTLELFDDLSCDSDSPKPQRAAS